MQLKASRQAVKVALIYVVAASAWIVFSDELLATLVRDPDARTKISIFKGWAFVLVTASLLYLVLRRILKQWARHFDERNQALEKLRESEERYRHFTDASFEGIGFSENGRILDVNDQILQMFGYERGEMIGKEISEFVAPGSRAKVAEYIRTGSEEMYLHQLTRKDGSVFYAEAKPKMLRVGNRTMRMAALRDVTERIKAAAELERREQNYREIYNATNEAIFLHDAATGEILDVNDATLRMFGFETKMEVLNRDVGFISAGEPPYSPAEAQAYIRRAMTEGSQVFEWRCRRKNGELFWCEVSLRSSQIGGAGRVLAVCRDITERKREGEQIYLQFSALTAAANAIVITDRNGNIEWVNPSFTRLTGYSAGEAVGHNPRVLKSGQHPHAFYANLWATISTGNVWQGELINKRKDGRVYTEEMTITPVRGADGQIAHFVAIKQDITEQHRLEEQLRQSQKMEAIGRLAGGVAHDFNNLLTVIGGNASLLMLDKQLLSPEMSDCVQQIAESTDRASGLTRQLLMFSRKQFIQLVRLDLNEVVVQMTKLLRRILGEDISMVSNYMTDLPAILADTGMVEQILLNLAVNARDAMPRGGQLTIATGVQTLEAEIDGQNPGAAGGLYVRLTVSDTGCGIAPEALPQIFEPFFTTKDVGKGSGLGLATVHGIVQQHNGRIKVASKIEQGTAFDIYFPVTAVEATDTKIGAANASPPRGTETIMVVEDELNVRLTVSAMLRHFGYTVVSARTGAEALKVWQEQKSRIQLLLTDIVMPDGMNGYELSRQLRADSPHLKVIYTSGYSGSLTDEQQTMVDGAPVPP